MLVNKMWKSAINLDMLVQRKIINNKQEKL